MRPLISSPLGLSRKWSRRGPASISLGAGAAVLLALAAAAPLPAEHTRFWRQADYSDFDRGTAKGVALRSDGRMVLAPKFAPFADTNLAYLWTLRTDSHGTLYAAGGSNAKVVRFDAAGKPTTVFESQEMSAQTMIFDSRDNLYVGTSPDGKVYKVTPDGTQSELFDPKTKYIWDLALGPDGTLYVATGDTGKIFAIAPDGKGELFYGSEETHIRTLALDGKGNLLAGTEPDGLVLRIPLAAPAAPAEPGGSAASRRAAPARGNAGQPAPADANAAQTRRAYVVYQTDRREITSLLPDRSGGLYVAAIGDKIQPGRTATPAPQAGTAVSGGGVTITVGPATPTASGGSFPPLTATGSSSVYRIAADDSPQQIWSSRDSLVYAMAFDQAGELLLGIGNEGAVVQLDNDGVFSRLARTESQQVTGFARATNGKVYVAGANPGKVFALGPELESEGTFESQAFDAGIFSHWGNLTWWGPNATGSAVELYVRCGNTSDPDKNWSDWSGPYRNPKGQEVQCPSSQFAQWRAVLHGGSGSTPDLSWVDLAYLPKNLAPQIDAIVLQNPGVRLAGNGGLPPGPGQPVPVPLRMPAAAGSQGMFAGGPRPAAEPARPEAPPPQGFVLKGYQGVIWTATDANDDDLTFSIYYRGEGEKDWKLLKDNLEQRFYSWDTTSMPDGAYYLKIVASDARSNPPDQALTAERESDRFVVDNTPPEIAGMTAQPAAGDAAMTVRFHAGDSTSAIIRAQYSLDAGDWTLAPPNGQLSDSTQEDYAITLHSLGPGEHTVAVRVYDQFDNQAAGKVTFTIPAASSARR